METTFVLVRHGETDLNREGRFRGRLDVPLNATGLAQAEDCARRVSAEWRVHAVYTSPLARAVDTAAPIARACGVAVERDPEFIDLAYGEWQGLTPDEVRRRWPELAYVWETTPERMSPPGGEALLDAQARALDGLRRLAKRPGQATVVIVSHDVIIRLLLVGVLHAPLIALSHLDQGTGAVNVVRVSEGLFTIGRVNDCGRFADPAAPIAASTGRAPE
jgi:phosphoserine phosphatase